jgi:DNA polymerase III subunit chi
LKVEFHSGVPDKLEHACRLLRKAQASGARVVVAGEPAQLDRLDVTLWTFDALAFVPHVRLRGGADPGPTALRTAVWLSDAPADCAWRDVLVNLGPGMVDGWQDFARVIEVVQEGDAERGPARQRWRTYGAHPGVELVHHALGTAP